MVQNKKSLKHWSQYNKKRSWLSKKGERRTLKFNVALTTF